MGVVGDRKVSKEAMVQLAKSMHGDSEAMVQLQKSMHGEMRCRCFSSSLLGMASARQTLSGAMVQSATSMH